ncbi:hypothetical protein KUBF_00630 [Bacteroides finegoldii]|nr:hypothetical protein KUBF_00630 [Bacteroides finegoldii]
MQAEKSAFFIYQASVMPLLGGKGTGLPRIRVKAALRAGRLKEIILAALRYFLSPSLDTKGQSGGRRPVKSGKQIPKG